MDTPNSPVTVPPEEKSRGLGFAADALNQADELAVKLLGQHPEVRSVIVVFDYAGGLNTADIGRVLWRGPDGPVTDPAAVIGSIQSALNAVNFMFRRAQLLEKALRLAVTDQATELARLQKEIHALEHPPTPTEPAPASSPEPVVVNCPPTCPDCGACAGYDADGHCNSCGYKPGERPISPL